MSAKLLGMVKFFSFNAVAHLFPDGVRNLYHAHVFQTVRAIGVEEVCLAGLRLDCLIFSLLVNIVTQGGALLLK
jgi:hypothetical protein